MNRRLEDDREVTRPDGSTLTLQGRALLLVRNVGHLMTTDVVRKDGQSTPEGLMDAMVTVACAIHDLKKTQGPRNSRARAIYVVKPKMPTMSEKSHVADHHHNVCILLSRPFFSLFAFFFAPLSYLPRRPHRL